MNKRNLAADRWRELIAQQQGSGLSFAAFCAQRGAAASTLIAWRRKRTVRQAPAFVELTPAAEPAAAARANEHEASRAAVDSPRAAVPLPLAPTESSRAPAESPQASIKLLAALIELGLGELCSPLLKLMKDRVLRSHVIQADETPVKQQLRGEERSDDGTSGGGPMKTCHFWSYVGDAEHPYILYDYQLTRGSATT